MPFQLSKHGGPQIFSEHQRLNLGLQFGGDFDYIHIYTHIYKVCVYV